MGKFLYRAYLVWISGLPISVSQALLILSVDLKSLLLFCWVWHNPLGTHFLNYYLLLVFPLRHYSGSLWLGFELYPSFNVIHRLWLRFCPQMDNLSLVCRLDDLNIQRKVLGSTLLWSPGRTKYLVNPSFLHHTQAHNPCWSVPFCLNSSSCIWNFQQSPSPWSSAFENSPSSKCALLPPLPAGSYCCPCESDPGCFQPAFPWTFSYHWIRPPGYTFHQIMTLHKNVHWTPYSVGEVHAP